MQTEIYDFVNKSRQKGKSDDLIRQQLISAGWPEKEIEAAINDDIPVPVPHPSQPAQNQQVQVANTNPVAVVENLSTRGIEYKIMFFALWISAIAFGGLVHDMIDALTQAENYPHVGGLIAATAIIVCFPIFAYLFLRLKKAEIIEPEIRKDQSRRKAVQSTLIFSFIIGVINVIAMVYIMMSGGEAIGDEVDTVALFMHTLVTVAICGGIFMYYWKDLHRE